MKDLKLDENGDIMFDANGELVTIDNAKDQNQKLLLFTHPGDWKEHPTVGIGLWDYLLGENEDIDELRQTIQSQFEEDGMEVENLDISEDFKLNVEANYKEENER